MRFTRFQLLRNGLIALPVLTTVGGATVAYFLSTMGVDTLEGEKFGEHLGRDITIGGIMGFLGGIAISSLGQAFLHHVKVVSDPFYRVKRRADNSPGVPSKATKVYTKSDLDDNIRSTTKTLKKYEEKGKAEKIERAQILEIGTEGIAQKKREQLGIKNSGVSKSRVGKSGTANKSGEKK